MPVIILSYLCVVQIMLILFFRPAKTVVTERTINFISNVVFTRHLSCNNFTKYIFPVLLSEHNRLKCLLHILTSLTWQTCTVYFSFTSLYFILDYLLTKRKIATDKNFFKFQFYIFFEKRKLVIIGKQRTFTSNLS